MQSRTIDSSNMALMLTIAGLRCRCCFVVVVAVVLVVAVVVVVLLLLLSLLLFRGWCL